MDAVGSGTESGPARSCAYLLPQVARVARFTRKAARLLADAALVE